MNKIILFLMTMIIGLSAHADYTVQTSQPLYPTQAISYSALQSYAPQYNQGYYQNPYQAQCQGQYANTYPYQGAYGYGNPYTAVNPTVAGLGTIGGTPQVLKNIGQSMIYSMIRGRGY